MQSEQQAGGGTRGSSGMRSGAGSGLTLLGVGGALIGAGLAWLPGRVSGLDPWIHKVVEAGATPGLVALVGIVVVAIGLALRKLTARIDRQSEALLSVESLGTRIDQVEIALAQVRGSLQELRIEAVYSKNSLASLVETLGEEANAEHRRGIQESVFQLAASMDQMGARIDERISAQNDVFAQTLQGFHDSLLATTVRIDELHGRILTMTMSGTREIPAERPGSLGVLDLIEDAPAPMPSRQSPRSISVSTVPGDAPRGPLPAPVVADAAVANTIAYLQTLFTDERVRSALDHMQRTHG